VFVGRRTLEETCGDEAQGEGRRNEDRRLPAREPLRIIEQLGQVPLSKALRQSLDLVGYLVDVTCCSVMVLFAELSR
jgi:hypothetical protein